MKNIKLAPSRCKYCGTETNGYCCKSCYEIFEKEKPYEETTA